MDMWIFLWGKNIARLEKLAYKLMQNENKWELGCNPWKQN